MSHDFTANVRQCLLPTLSRSARSPLNIASNTTDKLADGITGSAMTVSPPKPNVQSVRLDTSRKNGSSRRRLVTASKSEITSNCAPPSRDCNDLTRELRESLANERQVVASLQKIIVSCQIELAEAQNNNMQLQKELEQKKADFNEILNEERCARKKAQEDADDKSRELKLKQDLLNQCNQQISDLKSFIKKLELEISSLKIENEREIFARDTKLKQLKQNMADVLQGNSRQRQQQLDELSKELSKVQEEADILRSTLRSVKKNGCSNCAKLSHKLSKLEVAASAGDKTVADLKQLVASYEKQRVDSDNSRPVDSKLYRQHSKLF